MINRIYFRKIKKYKIELVYQLIMPIRITFDAAIVFRVIILKNINRKIFRKKSTIWNRVLFQNVRQTNENKFSLKNYNINFDFNNIIIILNIIRRVSNKTYLHTKINYNLYMVLTSWNACSPRTTDAVIFVCVYSPRFRANNALPRYNIVCPWRKRSESLIFLYTYVKRTV